MIPSLPTNHHHNFPRHFLVSCERQCNSFMGFVPIYVQGEKWPHGARPKLNCVSMPSIALWNGCGCGGGSY